MKCNETCTAPMGACWCCSEAQCTHLLKTWGGRAWCVECFPEVVT